MTCQARQYSDQMQCGRCGLAWDVNDTDPPSCKKATDRRAVSERRVTNYFFASGDKNPIKAPDGRRITAVIPARIPVELIDEALAAAMAQAYEAHASNGGSPVEAVQAAYRVFIGSLD